MTVYRIVRANRTSLDGRGASAYPGRWNKLDIPCVYTSSTPSLAQLELMVNTDDWKLFMTVPHVILHISVPEDRIHFVTSKALPADWNAAVFTSKTQEFGTGLLGNPDILAFSVPSAVSKTERNIVLNPGATNYKKLVKVIRKIGFEFDKRLLKG